MSHIIKYMGVLTEMWVTDFSEPIGVGSGEMERSVKASSWIDDAKVFSNQEVEEALRLTKRCHPNAVTVSVGGEMTDDGSQG